MWYHILGTVYVFGAEPQEGVNMTKIFYMYDLTYEVKECTAIARTDNGEEACRQEALLVIGYDSKIGEVLTSVVVFGYDMPETVYDLMGIDNSAWEYFDKELHKVVMR